MNALWIESQLAEDQRAALTASLESIRQEQSKRAISLIEDCRRSEPRDLLLGWAYMNLGKCEQALAYLAPLLLGERAALTPAGDTQFLRVLAEAASAQDPELASILDTSRGVATSPHASRVIKEFFFNVANRQTAYLKSVDEGKRVEARLKRERQQRGLTFRLEFLKCYSSYTPLTDDGDHGVGGGYFLVAGGFGCVIDPGHNFLENFAKRHTLGDIDAIVVTHAHDDHCADLPALLSLLYRKSKHANSPIQLYLDKGTFNQYKQLIDASDYVKKPYCPLEASFKQWSPSSGFLELSETLTLRPIPAKHTVVRGDDGTDAVGLHFILHTPKSGDINVVISGDTAWDPDAMTEIYETFRPYQPVLVPHVSTASEKEGLGILGLVKGEDGYLDNHLGIRGTIEMIQACTPCRIVLSEIGEELKKVIDHLSERIHAAFNVPCSIGMIDESAREIVDLMPYARDRNLTERKPAKRSEE